MLGETRKTTREMHAADVGKLTEKAFLQQVVELARLCGWKVYHPWLSVKSAAGFPDLVLARGDGVLFVELKTERGRVSDAQAGWLEALGECRRVSAQVWRPSQWEQIVERFARRGG